MGSRLADMFAELRSIAIEFDLDLATPEFVVIGMQSDGKSTFTEALLGFQFNIVSSCR
jgi:ABC-type uncharacterized transport system ATPase component